jgi:hypothetical protein
MDVYHYRRENLRQLCRDEHNGSISKLANRLDRQQSLISRWIGKTKNPKTIGSRTARRIEHEYRKTEGWLDVPHDVTHIKEDKAAYDLSLDDKRAALSDEAVEFAEGFQLLPEHIKSHLRLLINDMVVKEYGNQISRKAYAKASLSDQLHLNRYLKGAKKKDTRKRRKN